MDDRAPDRDTLDELADLADELLRQAADVRRQWAELGETLGLEPAPAPRPVAAEAEAADDGERAAAQFANADPARLVALDMMLSGRSREEVDEYLRTTFGDDVDPTILDEIFSEPAS
jgi:CheY-like chemotaxis protein